MRPKLVAFFSVLFCRGFYLGTTVSFWDFRAIFEPFVLDWLKSSFCGLYILVTDIDVEEDGTMEFYSDMMGLAETPSNWEVICNRELKDRLSSLPPNIRTYYLKCQKFDQAISKL